jgi:hypothetical protein
MSSRSMPFLWYISGVTHFVVDELNILQGYVAHSVLAS